MFTNRREAGYLLAQRLKGRPLHNPIVLGIPRGGVEVASAIARELGAELDIFLSKKIGAPGEPEYALGAVTEDGSTFIHPAAYAFPGVSSDYLEGERRHCMHELARRGRRLRSFRAPPTIAGRSVILVDDGIATGSTVTAALETLRSKGAKKLLVAVPVLPDDMLQALEAQCDEVVFLESSHNLGSVGRYYQDFSQSDDEEIGRLLNASWDRQGRVGA